MKALLLALASASLAVASGACTNAKFVSASTGGPGQIKFFYTDQMGHTGLIKCARSETGELSNCHRMNIVITGG